MEGLGITEVCCIWGSLCEEVCLGRGSYKCSSLSPPVLSLDSISLFDGLSVELASCGAVPQ